MKMIHKFKRTCKKDKGLEARIKREQFLQELKTPAPRNIKPSAQEILDRMRKRKKLIESGNLQLPHSDVLKKLRRLAGLE